MVGLTSVLLAGLSGLRAAQTGVATVSQNIANANTPGYVRTEMTLAPRTQIGAGAGVEVTGVKRAADRFLTTASYIAASAASSASARSDLLSRAQQSFGDPSSASSVFSMVDEYWSALTELGVDPSSSLRRSNAVGALQATYSEVHRIGDSVQQLIGEADERIGEAVSEAQNLINRIAELNNEIRLNKRTGSDTSSAENAQSALIDQLSGLMDVRATPQEDGSTHIRTGGGALLVGVTAAKINYTPNPSPYATHGVITLNEEIGSNTNIESSITGGSIKGLLQARDVDLPGLAEALGGYAGALADAMNAVHNENASSPAVSSMTGRQTGLLSTDALNFTGTATLAVTDSGGILRDRLTIDFDSQTITSEAPPNTVSFAGGGTIGDFVDALNTALGAESPSGGASFANGVLSVNLSNNGGIVIQQDSADPAMRAGRGFSHFFGLNDLVSRPTPLFFESGISGADQHGFADNGVIEYQIRDTQGRFIADRTITISGSLSAPGATWNDLLSALNATGTGLGEYGAFSLNSSTGQVTFAPNAAFNVTLVNDSTQRGDTGVAFSALNGLDSAATAGRATEVGVNALIANNTSRLAVGRPNLSVTLGTKVIEAGDNRGANALAAARDAMRSFGAAGVLSAQTGTLATYASRLGGEAGRLASDAERQATGAAAVATAAADRRGEMESVSIDDELMKMTTYQNAYAAAARVIQAATDMLDTLMTIGYR
ncbi:MAG: flagellar hook-associated protein FlgK [Alphaproteobacteria bacterium]|nr:flagellar hook-associated protein FlgK [Alphaproteobacteria bacterium]